MAVVTFDRVSLVYPGADRPSVDGFDLEIPDGEFLVLVGPSGCGKSTTLRMLAGLEQVSSGTIYLDAEDVTEADPKDRDIAMVFQNYALYPHLSVRENMSFGLKMQRRPSTEIRERVERAAEMLGLTEFLERKPKALSGGQRQRVAMGRAIVREPKVFLMDEPLSNLDAKLRVQTRSQIARLQRDLGVTTVYVTHDQVEAMTMGDRVAVMDAGVLQQVAPPRELYSRPKNVFVASFIGSPAMNLVETSVADDGTVQFGHRRIPVPPGTAKRVTIGMRPEHLFVSEEGGFEVVVDMVEELGSEAYVYGLGDLGEGKQTVVARLIGDNIPAAGDTVRFEAMPERLHVFDTETGLRQN
ncbi:ABC transporter ATP-binding protein [Gulosibacter molinativorax]|uniref:Sn-glycerol-3-phosphate ABC transporter ATP-binding protein UgpC n=1 Tax=Gulosibacter molinativorax TaxID=256821 RepID=A0ABT7CA52_9MICO|nr:sn-glycerol-3-phosphate ABC transporter ATP-binding protein UgpC [Gulosibacter molinativorax]MDJ1371985.1 sn-glycerol-3-phosphate ABC transporter ATP-binding protein UgpC [Gulosibacter molinativorax]QUY62651.1 Glycerol-3-phosphate transporter subunit ATP-binding component of ABC superfamily [Gulosibacter molinativorax]